MWAAEPDITQMLGVVKTAVTGQDDKRLVEGDFSLVMYWNWQQFGPKLTLKLMNELEWKH